MADNLQIDLKSTELTGIINRERINVLRELVNSEAWDEYRKNYDLASNLEIITKYPLQLDFELNASCNLKCPMCPISLESNKGKGPETWFDFETFKIIIDDGVNNGLKSIKLNYINEPLIRKDLGKFVKYAKDAGIIDIYLSSNGMLLKESIIRELIEAGLTRIQISIDAFTEDTYEKVRPGGDLNKVIQNVETLINTKKSMNSITPLIRVNFVRTELNEFELSDFINYWTPLVDMVGVQEMIKPPSDLIQIKSFTTKNKRVEGFKCSFPYKQLVINNEGRILPCCTFYGEEFNLGNIKNNTISEIWNSVELNKLRELHSNGRYYENDICKRCVEDGNVQEN